MCNVWWLKKGVSASCACAPPPRERVPCRGRSLAAACCCSAELQDGHQVGSVSTICCSLRLQRVVAFSTPACKCVGLFVRARARVSVCERERGGSLGSQQLLPPPPPAEVTPDGLPSQSTTLVGLALSTGGGGLSWLAFLEPLVRSGAPLRGERVGGSRLVSHLAASSSTDSRGPASAL